MSKLNLRTFLKCIYRRMARLERAVLLLLCIFAVKFVFSTAAHFAVPLQVVDMLGSGRMYGCYCSPARRCWAHSACTAARRGRLAQNAQKWMLSF